MNNQFFRPRVNGRIALSTTFDDISIRLEEKEKCLSSIEAVLVNIDLDKIDREELKYFIMTEALNYGRLTYGNISFIKKSKDAYLLILDKENVSKEVLINKEQMLSIFNRIKIMK